MATVPDSVRGVELSPAKRALLERRLRQPTTAPAQVPVTATGPVIVAGYTQALQDAFDGFQPAGSVFFVEEPDVVVGRQARVNLARSRSVRELLEFEYLLPGAADAFFHRHRHLRPAAVIPGVEYAVPFAARLAQRYGLPGADLGAAEILRDKAALRAVTGAAGIRNPRSQPVGSPADVRAFMEEQDGAIVIKPANRQGSVGTQIVAEPTDVDQAWAECTVQDEGGNVPRRGLPLRMLAEEYVDGEEVSVEMVVANGRPVFANVTAKTLFPGPRPVELGHTVPADLPAGETDRLLAETGRVLAAVGFDTGFVHCEWIVQGGPPCLVECAGRVPGDGIAGLIEQAWQLEIVRLYATVMKGQPVTEKVPVHASRGAAAWFLHSQPGRVVAVRGVDDARAVPGVVTVSVTAAPGTEVHRLRSSLDRVGFVAACAASPKEARVAAQRGVAAINVEVEPTQDGR